MINNDLIAEMIDGQHCIKNYLIFNLPESPRNSNNTTSHLTIINEVLKFLDLKSTPTLISRLGKPSFTALRLKLFFPDQ